MKNQETVDNPKSSKGIVKTINSEVSKYVFWPSAAIILVFILAGGFFPTQMEEVFSGIQSHVILGFSWYYVLVVASCVIFALMMGFSKFGSIKLAKNDKEKPEFSFLSWLSMLFAAGMGIGLVFFGVAEPLSHFAVPPPGSPGDILPDSLSGDAGNAIKAQFAMDQTFLHWGIHAWAIYVVVGLALAYTIHRLNRPVSIRYALEPILGKKIHGGWGNAIDVIALVGTLFGVTTSLGLGVMQIASGLQQAHVVPSDIDDNTLVTVQMILIVVITCITIFSLVSGVSKGMKWISNINLALAALLLVFVLIAGPTIFILREFVESIGSYLQNVVGMTFNVGAFEGEAGEKWQSGWTVFYWGWWISWSAFVGIFIARISKGRTVREFVFAVLIVPTLLTFLWFSVMGGTALYQQIFGGGGLIDSDGTVDANGALFEMLEKLPGGAIAVVGAVLLIGLFFITSSDSGSLVLSMLSTGGNVEPKNWIRIFWAVSTGLLAAVLLLSGGLTALQTVAILAGLPFSVIIIGIIFSTFKAFRQEIKKKEEAAQSRERDALTEYISDNVTEQLVVVDGPFRQEAFKEEALGKSIERRLSKKQAKKQMRDEK